MNQATETPVKKAFGLEQTVILECGKAIRVPRWSVTRAIAMSTTLVEIGQSLFEVLGNEQKQRFHEAERAALDKGLKEEDADFPRPEQFQNVSEREIAFAIPALIENAQKRVATFILDCTKIGKGGTPQASIDQILGVAKDNNWTLEDFIETLTVIIELNVTERLVKKIKRLFAVGKRTIRTLAPTK